VSLETPMRRLLASRLINEIRERRWYTPLKRSRTSRSGPWLARGDSF